MRRKSNHMDNMSKMRADGGPLALRLKVMEQKIDKLETELAELKRGLYGGPCQELPLQPHEVEMLIKEC